MSKLEEKAREYAEEDLGQICFQESGIDKESAYDLAHDAFIAGANWQKEQDELLKIEEQDGTPDS